MQVHLLGLPNYKIGWDTAPNNPFNTKIIYMADMLNRMGHTPICYAVEGSIIPNCEVVPVVSHKTFMKAYRDRDPNGLDSLAESTGVAWDEFAANTPGEIRKRVKEPMREILMNFMGNGMVSTSSAVSDIVLSMDPGIGHGGPIEPYRAYESYAWQNFMYGKIAPAYNHFPNMYERVIPAYFDERDYEFQEEKDDFYLYIGRLIWGKGISVAIEATHALGKKLVIIGGGTLDDIKGSVKCSMDHVQHVGVLGLKHKMRYLSRAKALIYFSLYIEPCGHAPIEAMLCGTPAITTDFGAFAETVKHGVSGYRCRMLNDVYWAAQQVKDLDPHKIREWAVKNFSIDAVAPLYQEFFDDIISYANKETDWYTIDKQHPKNMQQVGRYKA